MSSKSRSVQRELGGIANNLRALNARMKTVEVKTDDWSARLNRIEGALELRPATVLSVAPNGVKPEPTRALAPIPAPNGNAASEDSLALKIGRAILGVPYLFRAVGKIWKELLIVLLMAAFSWALFTQKLSKLREPRDTVRSADTLVGPPAPAKTVPR